MAELAGGSLLSRWLLGATRQERRPVDIVIGLDFGSAYTKAVVRDVDAEWAAAVPLPCQERPFIAPSNDCGSDSLKLHLVRSVQQSEDAAEIRENQIRLAMRLAAVLRFIKAWFIAVHGRRYRHRAIRWAVNLGVPTPMEDFRSSPVTGAFREVLLVAWLRSCGKEVTFGAAIDNDVLVETGTHTDLLNVWPELAAQITGYIRSPRYADDLHLLVDIGAGSVDVATFNLIARETKVILVSRLSWAGADVLRRRADSAEVMNEFGTDLFETLNITKRTKYPGSPAWKLPMRIFWCGGGATLPEYCERLKLIDSQLRRIWSGWRGFDIMPSRRPVDFEAPGLEDGEFHRLSVAHGLSYRIDDMGDLKGPPDDIPPSRPLRYGERYVGKDDV